MDRAAAVLPGGNTRTTTFFPPYPAVFRSGAGAWLEDMDGNRYVDLFYNGLSLIHGHAFPPIVDAMSRVLKGGTAWAGGNEAQFDFAELLLGRVRPGDLVRFTNTGSEAGMLAVSLARHVTGRPLILKFDRAYHGSYPDLEAGLYGRGGLPGRTLVVPFNNLDALEVCLEQHRDQVAAIIFEPVMYTGRVILPAPGYLRAMERLARRHSALLILDDCLMFRLAEGGSCSYFGLTPDLIVFGKFIGGGTPVGAVLGRRKILSVLDPRQPGCLFHGGSFNGNTLGMIAGHVTLTHLTPESIAGMDAVATALCQAITGRAGALGLAVTVTGIGSIAGIAFDDDPARHEDNPGAMGVSARFLLAAFNEGLAIGPGGLLALATVVGLEEQAFTIAAMERALEAVASETRRA